VATKKANGWGVFDAHGNVSEWIEDLYTPSYPTATDNPAQTTYRVVRGGHANERPQNCRSAFRNFMAPDGHYFTVGFRLARNKL